MPEKLTVEVELSKPRDAQGNRKAFSPEKVHSRVFEAVNGVNIDNPVIKSVYLSRPQSNNHTRARITVEFLD